MIEDSEILSAKILIVDDQEVNILLLRQMLQQKGYRDVSSTTDPLQVCAMHQANHYDLILLDLQMPVKDGFEVLEDLKQIEPNGYPPVLVVTAQPSHKIRALEAGAKDFVSKPFDLAEVQSRIRNMIEVRLLYRRLANHNEILEQTVLKRTEQLRTSEARFKSLTELSSDWYWEQDKDGNCISAFGPIGDMVGSQSNAWSQNILELANEAKDSAGQQTLEGNIANRIAFIDYFFTRQVTNGRQLHIQVSGEPIFDVQGRYSGYRVIGADVTDRMQPIAALSRWHAVTELINDAIILVDLWDSIIIDANASACQLLGRGRSQLVGLSIKDVGAFTIHAPLQDEMNSENVRLSLPDGTSRDVHATWKLPLIPNSNFIVGLLARV